MDIGGREIRQKIRNGEGNLLGGSRLLGGSTLIIHHGVGRRVGAMLAGEIDRFVSETLNAGLVILVAIFWHRVAERLCMIGHPGCFDFWSLSRREICRWAPRRL